MQPQLILLLLLLPQLLTSSCWAAVQRHQPRQLLRCPSEFETLVEPLPDSVGDAVLLMGPGVQLRTVGFLQDGALRVESDRLVLSASTAGLRGPYSGPHVLLCSDAQRPHFLQFSLSVQACGESCSEGPLLAPFLVAMAAVAVTVAIAVVLGLAVAVALAMRHCRRRSRRSLHGDISGRIYRDFRHLHAFRPQKLVESDDLAA